MIRKFEPLRMEIRNLNISKDYNKCIDKCYFYNNELKTLKFKDSEIQDDLRFIYYEIALSHYKLGNYDASIKYNKISLTYIEKVESKIDYREINSLWLMGECYGILGNIKEALRNYDLCSKLYRLVEEENLRICTLWNKAKLLKKHKEMLKLIKIYEAKNLKSTITTHGDFEYDLILSEMYKDLFQLYSLKFDIKNALKLVLMCKNNALKQELSNKFS